jgi:two-component system sensor histidine kinase KdpD
MTNDDRRPDPDLLLRRVMTEEERRSRAKLKVYFGYAPGVGKTYKMLELARGLVHQRTDVVVGYIETHKRFDTNALVLGMDMLPRRSVLHRGARLEEFDLEAALARKPQVILVDEFAHTNAPGGRHAKRWQDVFDLLHAGIEVHTTLNVQHVESLNDVVAQITGVRVRETVPDAVLDRADQIEIVDCPPDELLNRLAAGKVYVPEQAARASENFFKSGNLLALRELALRVAAQRVDAAVQEYRQTHEVESIWPAAERVLVCVGASPASARVVRAGCRIAAGLRAPWGVVYVEREPMTRMTQGDRDRLESHFRLAESLGGEAVRLTGGHAAAAILEYAREHNVTRIIIGKPTHSRLRDWLRGSLLDQIVRSSGDIDVHAIAGEEEDEPETVEPRVPSAVDWKGYLWSSLLVALVTLATVLTRHHLVTPDIVMLYLLAIMIVAVSYGRGPSVAASALSVLAYDFFFVPPYLTLAVSDMRHALTFAMMFAVGLLISGLTVRVRRQERDARARERRTSVLYDLSRDLGSAVREEDVALVIAEHAADVFQCGVAVLLPEAAAGLAVRARSGKDFRLDTPEVSVARWVMEHGKPAGLGTETLPGARAMCVPVASGTEALGVIALAFGSGDPLGADQRHFLEVFARQAAFALERVQLAEEAKKAALRARTEEMRSSLLSAVSHDLRTPLAAITGAASALKDRSAALRPQEQHELLESISEEAYRLERLVANLLDMTRLEAGAIEIRREWIPLEEIVGSSLNRLERELSGRTVQAEIPDSLPLVSADPILLEQVLVNLIENAAKHTPAGTSIDVVARASGTAIEIDVADHGPGITPGTESQIFEKFVRRAGGGVGGVGLGLAICRGIVQAHGGTIVAENRAGGGALFRVTLPIVGEAPRMPDEVDARGTPA